MTIEEYIKSRKFQLMPFRNDLRQLWNNKRWLYDEHLRKAVAKMWQYINFQPETKESLSGDCTIGRFGIATDKVDGNIS